MTGNNIVFVGNGDFAVPLLHALVKGGEKVALVISKPDSPKGRGQKLVPSPVSEAARTLGLPVLTPVSANAPEALEAIESHRPEFLVLADYGQLLKAPLLSLARLGPVNIHPSLLPRWRGPSPVVYTVLSGDDEAGVTLMFMDEGLDTGPLLAAEKIPLEEGVTGGELSALLAKKGGELLLSTLSGLRSGTVKPAPQEEARATWSKLIDRPLLEMDWTLDQKAAVRRINALSPKPGVRAWLDGKLIKLLRARPALGEGKPGEILHLGDPGITVGVGRGAILLTEVLPEGRKPMSAKDYLNSAKLARGGRFSPPPESVKGQG